MTQLTSDRSTSTFQYRLSAVLTGHTDDVRSLSTSTSSSSKLFSASRDGTVRSWTKGKDGWEQENLWKQGHEGFVNSVCVVEKKEKGRLSEDDAGQDRCSYLLTAGSDSLIQVYKLSAESDSGSTTPIHTLVAHSHNVCCLHSDKKGKRVASGSWDMTARIWNSDTPSWECERILVDHGAAVWDVLLLDGDDEGDLCLTAAADNHVRLFDGIKVRHLFKGHTGPVRALSKVLPDDSSSKLFASASNDGTIRIWNYSTGDSLTVLNHEDFVYSLVSIPSDSGGGLASSGEDGLVKIWNEQDGECDQIIEVPALSVWSLTTLTNGDLAAGCSDNKIWIFSRSEERFATKGVVESYEETLLEIRKNKEQKRIGKRQDEVTSVAVHQDLSVLSKTPGQRQGQVELVRKESDGSTIAYQWNGSTWEMIGQVVDPNESRLAGQGQGAREKMVHEGKEYDFVFQIDVSDDLPPIPLPYNVEDDIYEIAKNFIRVNELPDSYLDQIVEFVRCNSA